MNANADEIETVADLEVYGLSIKMLEQLDLRGYMYIRDLRRLSRMEMLGWSNVGPILVDNLQAALRNWQAGKQVRTVYECVAFPGRFRKNGGRMSGQRE